MTQRTPRSPSAKRLSELRSALPFDATLQNLISLVTLKLDLCARLPVFAFEAESEGFDESASFFNALATVERETVTDLLGALQAHLERTARPAETRVTS